MGSDFVEFEVKLNKRQRIPKRQLKKDNPEKLATQVTQDGGKNNNNNTICVGHHYT